MVVCLVRQEERGTKVATAEAVELIRLLEDQHTYAGHALQNAGKEALNWKPASTPCDSLAGLVRHIAAVQRLWLDAVIAGEAMPPDLATAHTATAENAAELQSLLDDSLARSRRRLESLTPEQLDEPRERRGRALTVRWAAYHTLEHTALHVGHMQLTRQVYDEQAGDEQAGAARPAATGGQDPDH
jgi:uncharacterized damage-inducible protein DinB